MNSSRLALQITDFTAVYAAVHHSGFSMSPATFWVHRCLCRRPVPLLRTQLRLDVKKAPLPRSCQGSWWFQMQNASIDICSSSRKTWYGHDITLGSFGKTGGLYIVHWFVKMASSIHTNIYFKHITEINIITYNIQNILTKSKNTRYIFVYKSWKHH